ncbi:MAG: acyl-CoA ligase (AMP-forming), exosortase A system-associated [Pseudomonadota bacterium]
MLLHAILKQTTEAAPDRLALITMDDQHLSYADFSKLVDRCAEQLRLANPEVGSRIGIYLPKHLLSAVAPFAISRIGCVLVPINPLLTEDQVAYIAGDCDLRILITSSDRAARLSDTVSKYELTLLLTEAGEVSADNSIIWDDAASITAKSIPQNKNHEPARQPTETLAALLYTSGSTGKPKGVMVSHENLILGAESVNEYLSLTANDRLLAVLPFSFDYGLNQLISSVAAGACCVLFEYLFPQDVIRAIEAHKITGLAGVPTLWMQLAAIAWPEGAADSVRYLTNSGGHLPRPILNQLRTIFPNASPVLMYGLTEAFRSTYLPSDQVDTKPDSMGIAIPNATILVVNDENALAAPEEQGELVHCGPLVAMGYWNRQSETAAVFRPLPEEIARQLGLPSEERVVWSGDQVRRDDEGYLYFLGRRDAMIKTSGYRVSSEEIEEALFSSEYVDTVAAVGVPDPKLGQAIVICVIASELGHDLPEQSLRQRLLQHSREHLPSYLIPKAIHFFSHLPHNPNGKINRRRLAAMLNNAQQERAEKVG